MKKPSKKREPVKLNRAEAVPIPPAMGAPRAPSMMEEQYAVAHKLGEQLGAAMGRSMEEAAGIAMLRWGAALEVVAEAAVEAAGGNPSRCAWTKPSEACRVVELDGEPFARVEIVHATDRLSMDVVTTYLREVQ